MVDGTLPLESDKPLVKNSRWCRMEEQILWNHWPDLRTIRYRLPHRSGLAIRARMQVIWKRRKRMFKK